MEKIERVLGVGWPSAKIEFRRHHLLAYFEGKLVAEVSLYPERRWAFFHYAYGLRGGGGDIPGAIALFRETMRAMGWTYALKSPMLAEERLPKNARDFTLPSTQQLRDLEAFISGYLRQRFPEATVEEIAIYAGMGWVLATKGKDGLGIRDIDVNVFFKAGGPRSLAWITKLKYALNGTDRVVDLYWNTLPANTSPREYIEAKAAKAKEGRWLTIVKRPWVSLSTGKIIWKGEV